MEGSNEVLEKIEAVLDALVENAETLTKVSQQPGSEKELAVLQQKQEGFVEELKGLQAEYQSHSEMGVLDPQLPITQRIMSKLQTFQQLNAIYIENITANRAMIKFKNQ